MKAALTDGMKAALPKVTAEWRMASYFGVWPPTLKSLALRRLIQWKHVGDPEFGHDYFRLTPAGETGGFVGSFPDDTTKPECRGCGHVKIIVVRGLCNHCYRKACKLKTAEQEPRP